MYLEKLEIQGFKSFAKKNKLIFSGIIDDNKKGLTAIVGPNGSGKSNVSDAIRWALGEQSIKTLRGKKSEDVIFSGSDKIGRLSFAEVSLFLNNQEKIKSKKIHSQENGSVKTDKDLDKILNESPEIVISRRVFRSGESEYVLNGSRVRLSDIQMLLAKANFGQRSYSVIGQGMVDNFLNSSISERKDFFDEATGVKQFQIKRDGALNKLESSYENLQQVEMLLSEIKPRLKSLTRQMDKLKRREEIEKRLKEVQLQYYGFTWKKINEKLNNYNQDYLSLEKNKIEKDNKLDELNEELNKIRATDNFQKINELQPRLKEINEQKNNYQRQLSRLEIELESQLESKGKFDLSWLNNKISELKNELDNLSAEISSLQKSRPTQEESALSYQLKEIEDDIKKNQEKINNSRKLREDKSLKESQLNKLEATIAAEIEARKELNINWLKNKKNELTSLIDEANKEKATIESQKEKEDENNRNLKTQLSYSQEEINKLNKELVAINEKIKKAAKSEGKEEAVNRIIKEFLEKLDEVDATSNLEKAKLLIKKAKKEFEEEIKKILTGESDEDTRRIQELQQAIIQETERKQNLNEKIGEKNLMLADLRGKISTIENNFSQLATDKQSIEEKIKKADPRKDDELKENAKNVKEEIKRIDNEIKTLLSQDRSSSLQEKKQEVLQKIQECRIKDLSIKERIRLLEDKKIKTDEELNSLNNKIEKSQTEFSADKIKEEKSVLQIKINELIEKERLLSKELEVLNKAKEEEKNEMFACQKKIQTIQEELNILSDKLNSLKVESTRQETRLEDLESNIRNDELSISEISQFEVLDINEEDLSKLQKTINSSKNQLEQIGGIDEETEKEYNETKERYGFLSNQTEDLDKAINSLEKIIKELDTNIKDRFDKEFKIISEKFNQYFQILFNGGSAKISKIMVEDLEKESSRQKTKEDYNESGLTNAEIELKIEAEKKLNKIKFLKKHNAVGLAGIDIEATPPGKKIQSVSMLSGGERALTAIALICAIINANPSPFVVLDEVDAALDESNSERLAKILDDLSDKTQFITITHNRASMKRASILYGVTMKDDGVSQVISIKLDDINKLKKRA